MTYPRLILFLFSGLFCLNANEGVGIDQALFHSKTLKRNKDLRTTEVNIDIKGLKELYLVVGHTGDGINSDHVNWVEPTLVGPKGRLKLTSLKWKEAIQGSGSPKLNLSYKNKPLRIGGKTYADGIGVHAASLLAYDLPEGYESFQAKVGMSDDLFDAKLGSGCTVEVFVFANRPNLDETNRVRSEKHIPLSMFTLPDDLEISVWATSPMLFNPTNMDIDAKGRIWVAEGMNYRGSRLRPEGDRIVVLEDSDHDGKADKHHTFVQDKELISPLGIAVVGNRVIVSQPPHLLVYHDLNNDAIFDPKVDKKEVLLSGFKGSNHDHSLHSATIGPNGQLYFNTGNAGNFEATDKNGTTVRAASSYNGGIDLAGIPSSDGHVYLGGTAMRMNLDGTDLNVIGHNFRNSYEQAISSFGDVFQNDNDDPPASRTTWLMEYGNLGFSSNDGKRTWHNERRPGQTTAIAEWRQEDPDTIPAGDVYGGGAPTGIVFYENGSLGKSYRGLLLSCEPSRNTVFGYYPKLTGAGMKLERFDFLTTNREQDFAGSDFIISKGKIGHNLKTLFRPSDVSIGTDGALYIADWFDPRVGGHGTLDKNGYGTIYRISKKGDNPKPENYDFTSTAGQIQALKSPAVNVRGHALHTLTAERKSLKELQQLTKDSNPYYQARAIWALASLNQDGLKAVEAFLSNADESIRVVAYRSLRHFGKNTLELANRMSKDTSAAVQREVAISLRNYPVIQSFVIFQTLIQNLEPSDRWSIAAIGIGAKKQESDLYQLLRQQWPEDAAQWSATQAKIAWLLHPESAVSDLTSRALSKHLKPSEKKEAIVALGFINSEASVESMVTIAKHGDAEAKKEATWWIHHRDKNTWRDFHALKKLTGIERNSELADSLIPYNMAPSVELPSAQEMMSLQGDANRGKVSIARCTMCHRLNGSGVDFGPDLSIFGKNNPKEVLLTAILFPSNDIAHGYKGVEIKTKNGKTIQGLVIADGDPVVVKGFGGSQLVIDKSQISSRREMKESLMIPAKNLGITAQDVADIVEFLKQ